MADLMTFPNTVDEFMDQYKITDTEQVYTNGSELVPIFRMKQWFEHLPSADVVEVVRCKECKYFYKFSKYCREFMTEDEDGFCKWGERREDGEVH